MNCGECGNPLVRVMGEETITTLEGETLVFRRTSDYLLCRNCLRLYSVVELRGQTLKHEVGEDITDLQYFSLLADEEKLDASAEAIPIIESREN